MKRIASYLLITALLLSLGTVALASGGYSMNDSSEPEDSLEYYTIGNEENTFEGLYKRMCINLDLQKYPLPEADTEGDPINTAGEYEEYLLLKDDNESIEYIGHIFTKTGVKQYIERKWIGFHEDGSLIGMTVFYMLDGKYLGNIQYDYFAGTSTSSHNSPYFVPGQPINKR